MDKEMIYNAIKDTIPILIEIFTPIIIPILVAFIVWEIIKFISRKIVYFFSVVSGDTRRETRRKMRSSDNIIDLVSAYNDAKPKKQ